MQGEPMKAPLRIPLRAVLYRESGVWIAHCLELDLLGDGETREKALNLLSEAIGVQIEASLKYDCANNLFRPADPKYFYMFAAGKDVAIGELQGSHTIDSVTVEEVGAREYQGPVETDSELSPA
jgi:predicted RNase H-like HicB family nuclease